MKDPDLPDGWHFLAQLRVDGRPSSISGRHGRAWREAVANAVALARIKAPMKKRFFVRITFATQRPVARSEYWDIDNLVKPTLDAMTGLFGSREWTGLPQAADDRVEGIYAERRQVRAREHSGADITVFVRDAPAVHRGPARPKRLGHTSAHPLFGASVVREAILRYLFTHANPVHVRELARRIGHDPGAVSRELGRLQGAGLIVSELIGRSRTYRRASTSLARDVERLVRRLPSPGDGARSLPARVVDPANDRSHASA